MQRLLRLTIATACAGAVTCQAALAANDGSPLGYAISAVGFRSYFTFNGRPGETVGGSLGIVNLASGARTIVLSAVDVSTAAAGGLQYGNGPSYLEGRWLKLASTSVEVSGHGSTSVPFTVRLPATARPGDHFIGIAALDRRVLSQRAVGRGPVRLRLIPRLAMTVRVRLPGPLTRKLALGGLKISVAPSGASLELQISSPGNALIGASTGNVTVSQGSTPLFSRGIELGAFVPKTAITYHVPWEGTPVEGTYNVRGELIPTHAQPIPFDRTVTFGATAIRQYRRQTGRPAKESSGTPVALVVVLVAALATALAFGVAYARLRGRLRAQT